MTRALALALALLYLAGLAVIHAAHAGDTAPGAHLWPSEPQYRATVIELATLGLAMFPEPRCDLRPCGDWYVQDHGTPDPAPVPLPPTLLLITAAIAALIWKGGDAR